MGADGTERLALPRGAPHYRAALAISLGARALTARAASAIGAEMHRAEHA